MASWEVRLTAKKEICIEWRVEGDAASVRGTTADGQEVFERLPKWPLSKGDGGEMLVDVFERCFGRGDRGDYVEKLGQVVHRQGHRSGRRCFLERPGRWFPPSSLSAAHVGLFSSVARSSFSAFLSKYCHQSSATRVS